MSVSYLSQRKAAKAKASEPTPRYAGPVLVDPASNGRKLVTDYADLWGRTGTPPATGHERSHKRHFGYHGGVLLLVLALGVVIGVIL